MPTLHQTFIDIAQILDDNSDKDLLKIKLSNPNYDFDNLVKIGSKELVLTTIFCKLKQWNILHCLPTELIEYLDELTSINRNRNETILSEIKAISVLFQEQGIKHCFLKGSALLAAGYYKDKGERLIGDIDILVAKDQLQLAQSLLVKTDYNPCEITFGDKYFEHKHLPRLIPKTRLSAVEIHRKLIQKKTKRQVNPSDYLNQSKIINNISIGDENDALWHTALNFEINDYGYLYNFLGLRNTYDFILLKSKLSQDKYRLLLKNKYVNSMVNKMSIYFNSIEPKSKNLHSKLLLFSFIKKQQYSSYKKISYNFIRLINFLFIIGHRFIYFIINSEYRKDSLKDNKRIISILKKRLNLYKN